MAQSQGPDGGRHVRRVAQPPKAKDAPMLHSCSRTARRLAALSTVAMTATLLALAGPAAPAHADSSPPVFGAQFHAMWSNYTDAQREQLLDQLKASGTRDVRIDVSWAMLQPTSRGSYDMNWGVPFVDRVLDMVTSRGMRPLVTLWMTPAWANGGAGDRVLPTDPQDYANALRWAAQRWAGQVPAWEVWNEPNQDGFMAGASPAAYVRLLKAAYPALHQGNPAAQLVLGGPASVDTNWLSSVYAAGAHGSFDVMAVHPYQAVADDAPEKADDGSIYHFTHMAAVHRMMVAKGDGDKEIWATEFGWSSHANTGGEDNWQRGVTEQQQGAYLVRSLELARTTMPYVTHLYWYTDRDDPSSGEVQNRHYGLFSPTLVPKPAYAAVKAYLTAAGATAPAPVVPPPVVPVPVVPVPVVFVPVVPVPVLPAPAVPAPPAPVPAPAPAAAAPTTLTTTATATTVTAGGRSTLTGTLRKRAGAPVAGRTVTVWTRPGGHRSWSPAASLPTTSRGTVRWTFTPTSSTAVQLRYAGSAAERPATATRTIALRPKVTAAMSARRVDVGRTVRLSGSVTSRLAGATVRRQSWYGGAWHTRATARVSSSGVYSFRIYLSWRGVKTFRVYVPAASWHLSATSSVIRTRAS